MSKFRPIEAAENAAENIQNTIEGQLLDWLPRKHCDSCGSVCEPREEYVERQAMVCEIWVCSKCGKRYYRDEEEVGLSFEMWDR
jgi:hypothetical protein